MGHSEYATCRMFPKVECRTCVGKCEKFKTKRLSKSTTKVTGCNFEKPRIEERSKSTKWHCCHFGMWIRERIQLNSGLGYCQYSPKLNSLMI